VDPTSYRSFQWSSGRWRLEASSPSHCCTRLLRVRNSDQAKKGAYQDRTGVNGFAGGSEGDLPPTCRHSGWVPARDGARGEDGKARRYSFLESQ
jgi:hypothetical protein